MKYWFQIHTGNGSQYSSLDIERILRTLARFERQGLLAGVLGGWSFEWEVYRKISQSLRAWGLPFYFKTAVFSELEEGPSFLSRQVSEGDYEPMVDVGLEAAKPYPLNEQEHFLFRYAG